MTGWEYKELILTLTSALGHFYLYCENCSTLKGQARNGSAISATKGGKFNGLVRDLLYLYFDPATTSPDHILCRLLPINRNQEDSFLGSSYL